MFSTLIELLGLAALIAGVCMLAGVAWALIAACPVLLFIGAVTNDTAIARGLKKLARSPAVAARRLRPRRRAKAA